MTGDVATADTFGLSTDPRVFYTSTTHAPVFADVLAGIRGRDGLVVVTGESGVGKTLLCRSVLAALDQRTYAAFVPDPLVSREDLLKILLVEFGVVAPPDLVRGHLQGASHVELRYALSEFLRAIEPTGACAVLLIDDAQKLPAALADEVRILADLEGTRRLLQVMLIGQPELAGVLQQPHMRQLRQRVTTQCELRPLDRGGVAGYIHYRLAMAGKGDELRFTSEALDLIGGATGGVPSAINRICDRLLQRNEPACAASIGPDAVRQAIAQLPLPPASPPPGTRPIARPPAEAPLRLYRPARPARGTRTARPAIAAAALVVLGGMSGLTLAVYWLWAGPLVTERVALPAVRRPSMRIAPALPAVHDPDIDAIGDPIGLPVVPGAPVSAAAAEPLWVVQVGAFPDRTRASSLAGDLAKRGFRAFTGAGTGRAGAPLHLVLVGPFAVRREAAAALDRIEDIPGTGRPMLQPVPSAAAVR